LTLDFERYQSAVREFNDKVSELAAKLEQIANAREAALRASAELREELEASDKRLFDVAASVRKQVALEFDKKTATFEKVTNPIDTRRVS
jgi:predicted  nucleic acid-binding Zn-ribbon protein